MTFASVTSPNRSKAERNDWSDVFQLRPPTNNFFAIFFFPLRDREGSMIRRTRAFGRRRSDGTSARTAICPDLTT
jgi:hypothetical protein